MPRPLKFLIGFSITHRMSFQVCTVAHGAWCGLASACLSDPDLSLLSSWVSRRQPHWPSTASGACHALPSQGPCLALPSACDGLPWISAQLPPFHHSRLLSMPIPWGGPSHAGPPQVTPFCNISLNLIRSTFTTRKYSILSICSLSGWVLSLECELPEGRCPVVHAAASSTLDKAPHSRAAALTDCTEDVPGGQEAGEGMAGVLGTGVPQSLGRGCSLKGKDASTCIFSLELRGNLAR